jgi:hypothetical protein
MNPYRYNSISTTPWDYINVLSLNGVDNQPFVTEAGWGYTILTKGKPYIRYSSIPAVEGNRGSVTGKCNKSGSTGCLQNKPFKLASNP